jgi:hypothetical protein
MNLSLFATPIVEDEIPEEEESEPQIIQPHPHEDILQITVKDNAFDSVLYYKQGASYSNSSAFEGETLEDKIKNCIKYYKKTFGIKFKVEVEP